MLTDRLILVAAGLALALAIRATELLVRLLAWGS
jgi:hypothetical protein